VFGADFNLVQKISVLWFCGSMEGDSYRGFDIDELVSDCTVPFGINSPDNAGKIKSLINEIPRSYGSIWIDLLRRNCRLDSDG
jgi:hypothetical protein